MSAYFNEVEPYAVDWLRCLMKEGLIPDGEIDSRSILDVRAVDLRGFTQCHFFAGLGGWSRALDLAGWDRDRPVWTGSCPCQPFSLAGRHGGRDDDRHLWPAWYRLIQESRPAVVFGEQVASALRHGWWDHVASDLEAADYACAAVGVPALAVGAPHIRQRLWFIARANPDGRGRTVQRLANGTWVERASWDLADRLREGGRSDGADFSDAVRGGSQLPRSQPEDQHARPGDQARGARGPVSDAIGPELRDVEQRRPGRRARRIRDQGQAEPRDDGAPQSVAGADGGGLQGHEPAGARARRQGAPAVGRRSADQGEADGDVADAGLAGSPPSERQGLSGSRRRHEGRAAPERGRRGAEPGLGRSSARLPSPMGRLRADPFWTPDWEDGIPRTVAIHPGRVGRLKALGNAIVPQVGATIIAAFMEIEGD